jgi:hypothetical protein
MATLVEIVLEGTVVEIDPGLEQDEEKRRTLYGTLEFVSWLESVLPTYPTDQVYADLSPLEQVVAALVEFVIGEPILLDRRFKKLARTPSFDVWEIKTDDVRIFGWFPQKDVFVCCFGDLATDVKVKNKYDRYMSQVKYFMDRLPLDEPKSVQSKEYTDVLSNKVR